MFLFLMTFVLLYGGIHFYFFYRARGVLHLSGPMQVACLVFIVFLIAAPILVRVLETLHFEHAARALAFTGYVWMAFIFLFFTMSLSFELIRVVHKLLIDPSAAVVPLKALTFSLAVFLSIAAVVYGYIDARHIRTRYLEIVTPKLPSDIGRLRIVQISDVHVGIVIREHRLDAMLKRVSEAKPDILVSTGDLLDGELDNIMDDARRFAAIETRFGKFAVLGNHEYYAGLRRSIAFTEAAGFTLLRDEAVEAAGIVIFGEDDITGRKPGETEKSRTFARALSHPSDRFVLLLKHQPYVDPNAAFDLQLSGHTHAGQIFPFGLVTKIYFPRNYGLHRLADDRLLYVNRGAGTWGPPVRVLAPPEITVIDLIASP